MNLKLWISTQTCTIQWSDINSIVFYCMFLLGIHFNYIMGGIRSCGGLMVSMHDSERSRFESWPETLCCVLGKDAPHCVSLLPAV